MTSELLIVIDNASIGRVRADRAGRLSLEYEPAWRESSQGHSLSVSMPLARITYPHQQVVPYLWNLLPENTAVLQRWSKLYHVSAANPFKLLGHVGSDVPGAAQFLPPEHLQEIQSRQQPDIQWMSTGELAERLRQRRVQAGTRRQVGQERRRAAGRTADSAR
jgi:serine/threonine-protein kinase HipA